MIKELEYDLTKEDMEKGIRDFPPAKRGITKIQIFGFLIIVLLAIICGIFSGEYLFPILIIIFFLILMFLPKGKMSFIKIFGEYENQKLNLIINSDENTFINNDGVSTTVTNWNRVLKIDNAKNSILIYIATNRAYIIPKRIFKTEQEMNETWELIQECYNKNREELK